MSKEKKDVVMTIKITKTAREELERRAEEEGRSLGGHIQYLILQDAKDNK